MRRLASGLLAVVVLMSAPLPVLGPSHENRPVLAAIPVIYLPSRPSTPALPDNWSGNVLHGNASTYGPGYSSEYLAVPIREWRNKQVRVCYEGRCYTHAVTDLGPDQRLHPDRVVDLSVEAFEYLCQCDWTRGILRDVTVELLS